MLTFSTQARGTDFDSFVVPVNALRGWTTPLILTTDEQNVRFGSSIFIVFLHFLILNSRKLNSLTTGDIRGDAASIFSQWSGPQQVHRGPLLRAQATHLPSI